MGEIVFPGAYTFVEINGNEAILVIKTLKGEPQTPHIFCDGSANALMVYNNSTSIALCNIASDFRAKITDYSHLYVCELGLETEQPRLVRSYYVPITATAADIVPRRKQRKAYCRSTSYDALPVSSGLPEKQIITIKEQLIEKAYRCNIEVKKAKATIEKKFLLY